MDSDELLTFASAEQGFVYMKTFFSAAPDAVQDALRRRVLLETASNRLQELSGYIPDFLAEKWEERKIDVACDIIRAVCDSNPGFLRGLKQSAGTNIVSGSEVSEFASVLPLALERVREEKISQSGVEESPAFHFYEGKILPEKDVVFVFGSNPEGRHGAGSAKVAVESFGAVYGKGEGLQGNSYALPTKDISSHGFARFDSRGYEVSSKGDVRFSAMNAVFAPGTVIFGHDVGGRTIESVYQHGVKQGDWVSDNNFKTGRPIDRTIIKGNTEDDSFYQGYLPLWKEWARQNPELMEELRRNTVGRVLTDSFASTKVSQARALSDILNDNNYLRSIPADSIVESIRTLYKVARENSDKQFKVAYMNAPGEVTLNGYNGSEMVSMFLAAGSVPDNVQFSSVWKAEMERQIDGGAVEPVKDRESRVFVSYYGSRSIPSDAYRVCISTSVPKGYNVDASFSLVYPSFRDMVGPHKDGLIVDEVYRKRYETLLERNKAAILRGIENLRKAAAGRDVYLLCYCRPGVFCHRYLLQNFLLSNGVDCQENPEDRKMYSEGRIPEFGAEIVPGAFDGKVDADFRLEASEPLGDRVVFTSSKGGYSLRTQENANASEVDFTLAFAVDFTTGGEVCTAKAAGDSLVRIPTQVRNGHLDLSREAVDRAVGVLRREIPAEYFSGESCGLNIAGNGLVTYAEYGVRQFEVDLFVASVLKEAADCGLKVSSIRSGGQTGADEAAYVASRILDVPLTVHAPADWSYRVPSDHVSRGVDIRDGERFVGRFELKDCNRYCEAVDKVLFQERNVTMNVVKQMKL